MLYDYLETLCKERGISVSWLLGEVGVSKSSASRWKSKGYEPSNKTKKKIADYFNVSVQQLENGDAEKPAAPKGDELTADEMKLLALFRGLRGEDRDLAIAQAELLARRQSAGFIALMIMLALIVTIQLSRMVLYQLFFPDQLLTAIVEAIASVLFAIPVLNYYWKRRYLFDN